MVQMAQSVRAASAVCQVPWDRRAQQARTAQTVRMVQMAQSVRAASAVCQVP